MIEYTALTKDGNLFTETTPKVVKYILVLDTDKYSGNFERQLAAYSTGALGECGAGEAKAFMKAGISQCIVDELEDVIQSLTDIDDGCSRPCKIYPTPGWVNDGMGNEYRQSRDIAPTQEQIEAYRKASRDSQLLYLKCVREYTAKGLSNWTREALEREEQRFRDIDTSTINGWFPAYHSVGVYLYNPLSPEALKVVIERAKEYCTKNNITLESVRLVTEYSYKTSE